MQHSTSRGSAEIYSTSKSRDVHHWVPSKEPNAYQYMAPFSYYVQIQDNKIVIFVGLGCGKFNAQEKEMCIPPGMGN